MRVCGAGPVVTDNDRSPKAQKAPELKTNNSKAKSAARIEALPAWEAHRTHSGSCDHVSKPPVGRGSGLDQGDSPG